MRKFALRSFDPRENGTKSIILVRLSGMCLMIILMSVAFHFRSSLPICGRELGK
jgi:hypothetical protein